LPKQAQKGKGEALRRKSWIKFIPLGMKLKRNFDITHTIAGKLLLDFFSTSGETSISKRSTDRV